MSDKFKSVTRDQKKIIKTCDWKLDFYTIEGRPSLEQILKKAIQFNYRDTVGTIVKKKDESMSITYLKTILQKLQNELTKTDIEQSKKDDINKKIEIVEKKIKTIEGEKVIPIEKVKIPNTKSALKIYGILANADKGPHLFREIEKVCRIQSDKVPFVKHNNSNTFGRGLEGNGGNNKKDYREKEKVTATTQTFVRKSFVIATHHDAKKENVTETNDNDGFVEQKKKKKTTPSTYVPPHLKKNNDDGNRFIFDKNETSRTTYEISRETNKSIHIDAIKYEKTQRVDGNNRVRTVEEKGTRVVSTNGGRYVPPHKKNDSRDEQHSIQPVFKKQPALDKKMIDSDKIFPTIGEKNTAMVEKKNMWTAKKITDLFAMTEEEEKKYNEPCCDLCMLKCKCKSQCKCRCIRSHTAIIEMDIMKTEEVILDVNDDNDSVNINDDEKITVSDKKFVMKTLSKIGKKTFENSEEEGDPDYDCFGENEDYNDYSEDDNTNSESSKSVICEKDTVKEKPKPVYENFSIESTFSKNIPSSWEEVGEEW